jgi:hypothetical protein
MFENERKVEVQTDQSPSGLVSEMLMKVSALK